jgi:hypothetical protein
MENTILPGTFHFDDKIVHTGDHLRLTLSLSDPILLEECILIQKKGEAFEVFSVLNKNASRGVIPFEQILYLETLFNAQQSIGYWTKGVYQKDQPAFVEISNGGFGKTEVPCIIAGAWKGVIMGITSEQKVVIGEDKYFTLEKRGVLKQ